MKKIALIFSAASLLMLACNSDKKTEEGKMDEKTTETKMEDKEKMEMPDSATMMKNFQEYGTPGDMHKMMATWDGTWNSELTMWMEPGAPETKSTSMAENKMIMNGLYQQSTHTGEMMGMPFNGLSTVGYDNHEKQFVSTWIDNMGSGIMVMKGPWDDGTKTMNLKGKMTDPGTKSETEVRETFTIVDNDTQEMTMYVKMPDGSEFKTMHIKFTRKK